MGNIRVGKPDTKQDAPAHTPGISQGNEPGGIEKLVLLVVVLSILPIVWHAYRDRMEARRTVPVRQEASVTHEP